MSLGNPKSIAKISANEQSAVMKKINVVGTSGSGKSALARKLAETLSIEYIEMDALFWGRNWQLPSDEEFFLHLRKAIKGEKWVLDGNYTRTIPIKWRSVDTVIWIDFSFIRTLTQSVKRAVIRIILKKEIWPDTGNTESFKMTFLSRDSILLWMIKTFRKNRSKYEEMMQGDRFGHIRFIRLKSPGACSRFLGRINEEGYESI